jgi:hypothetical protein
VRALMGVEFLHKGIPGENVAKSDIVGAACWVGCG